MSARKWVNRDFDTVGACNFVEHTCDQCGKIFFPAPYHVYKRTSGSGGKTKWFCSYHCMVAWDKEHPQKKTVRHGQKG